jgi:hypothetical protein
MNAECGMPSDAIEAPRADGTRLRIEFTWRGDRYGHVISMLDPGGQSQPLLESVEGSSDDPWPPSPPLQSLSIETLPDDRSAALLVGMAGRSHWSASIEPDREAPALVFDVACRHPERSVSLGSRYRHVSAAAESTFIHAEGADVVRDSDIVSIRPTAVANGTGTTRWKFSVIMPPTDDRRAPAEATALPR